MFVLKWHWEYVLCVKVVAKVPMNQGPREVIGSEDYNTASNRREQNYQYH